MTKQATDELDVAQAAALIGVTAESIRRYLRSGELNGYMFARKKGWRTSRTDIDAFLIKRTGGYKRIAPPDPQQ